MNNGTKAWLYLFIIVSAVALPVSLVFSPRNIQPEVLDIIKATSAALLTLLGFIIRDMRNRDK